MFSARQLKDMMAANPFRPFRIRMSNGETYDVPNHDSAFILANCIEIALESDAQGFPQRMARCSYLHINSIEDMQPA